jgi:ubiquinone/menaquinone biosynthesis C-methylase UbiE
MGLYARYIFPRLMDRILSGKEFQRLREDFLKEVSGSVLEIGLGTGLNLIHYPTTVTLLYAVEPETLLPERLVERGKHAPFPIELKRTSAEALPFNDRTFDCAVSTWTLCTIPDPIRALQEVRRVLKPDGRFHFLEHGRSDDESIAKWQDLLNPIQRIIGCGCNLNRRIDQLIEQGGFSIAELDRFKMQTVPQIGGSMYRGQAVRGKA